MLYIAFLRGINVSGQKKIKMANLRQKLSECGFGEVHTYIQSGNLALRADAQPSDLERALKDCIAQHYGWDVPVVVRTVDEMKSILAQIPFKGKKYLLERIYFALLHEAPSSEAVEDLTGVDFSPEEVIVQQKTVYLYSPDGAGKSKLNNNFLERKLKVSATTRNLYTMQKMIALCEEL